MNNDKAKNAVNYSRRLMIGAGAASALSLIGCDFSKSKVASSKPGPVTGSNRQKAIDGFPPYLTEQDDFLEVTRSRPYLFPPEKLAKVGLTRETWKLEIDADPDYPTKLENPLTKDLGTAFDFKSLMKLAQTKSVRFAKALTCLNGNRILGMGVWEGVPLRDVLWMTEPKRNLRRVFYYGYHEGNPKRRFQSSLPVGRVLEDAFGVPPVILCYKLNGEWLSSKRGGPVRLVVPETYAFKSVKWLTNVVLTNLHRANDSYARGNNDIDTLMKTFAGFVDMPNEVKANEPFVIKGYAQVGVSGVDKVQVWVHNNADGDTPLTGRFVDAPWVDAKFLPAPTKWGHTFDASDTSGKSFGFDAKSNRPKQWPMRLTKLNWVYEHPGLVPGTHLIRCRTIDSNGQAQPMPRPFQKSGHAKIELHLVKAT